MYKLVRISPVALAFVFALGCGRGPVPAVNNNAASTAIDESYLLASEPTGAKGVSDIRKEAADGDEVLVVGRIGGSIKPWVDGRAAFMIVDPSLKSCRDAEGDSCPTPWDYCCTP